MCLEEIRKLMLHDRLQGITINAQSIASGVSHHALTHFYANDELAMSGHNLLRVINYLSSKGYLIFKKGGV